MTTTLDQSLVFRAKRRVRPGELTAEEAIAINLLWRKGVSALRLAKVFDVSPNTIYYRCLTGSAKSYKINTPNRSKAAAQVNKLIDEMGEKRAWAKYVTPKIVADVEKELRAELRRRA